jgi:hypothetical protein
MADDTALAQGITLTPLQYPEDWVPGKYAAFPISSEPMYGPDELGEYKAALDDLVESCTRADSAARNWEIMQAWEARLFSRNYQFLISSKKGWGMAGGASGAEISGNINAQKLFSCNVYGSRQDKIVAALSREVPALTFVPKRDKDPIDQTAADEAKKYLTVWMNDAGIKDVMGKVADLFYTDDRVCLYTGSWADEQAWETETPDEQQEEFGADIPDDGVSPETEMQPAPNTQGEVPAVREITKVYGKLECKVPIYADDICEMPWVRLATEQNINILKERYPWIEDKISAGAASKAGSDQIDRIARINVRLAVQVSSSSGESVLHDATEQFTWYRPSQYRAIKDKDFRKACYQYFPDGMLVVHAGGELAFVRNESMSKHLVILHPKHGSGQNRRSIGANYLPLQKILNANISLVDRYFRSAVPRKFHNAEKINSEAINGQANDPARSTPVSLNTGETIESMTGVENVPTPNTAIFEFVQWLIDGAPEAMDGASPAMFGMEDADTFGATKLNRDQALQVFSMPWAQMCIGLAKAAEQAVACAAENRVASIAANVPGQGALNVELGKLRGNTLCYPESMEIPQTIAEQEAQMAELIEQAPKVALYQAIVNDPRNISHFANFPSLSKLEIPGKDDAEQQQGEFELLLQSGPLPNPQLMQIQQQVQQAATDPEAQTPEGQQALMQLQQAMQSIPPMISSVPVAQDASENHAIHAAITLGFLTSPDGRKLKNGDEQQQAVFQNIHLHWQEHVQMGAQLTPPKEIEFKGSLSVDPSKFAPEAQAKIFQAAGLQVAPEELQGSADLSPHEVTTEKEGVDENGVPVKQKISLVGKGLDS